MQNQFVFETQLIPLSAKEQRAHDNAMFCASKYRAAEADLLKALDEADCLRLHEKFREQSTFNYCINYLKLTEAVAGYFCTVARKSRKIPEFRKAIEAGEIPVSKAARVCGVINESNQKEWIAKAAELSKNKLEQAVAEVQPGKAKRDVATPIAKNITRLAHDVTDQFMEKLKRVVDLECSRSKRKVSRTEALEAALDAYLKQNDPLQKAERAEKRKSAQAETKVKDARAGEESDDIPAARRHEVNLRDKCRCHVKMPNGEICGEMKWTEIHHVTPRGAGGTHELSNLTTMCGAHHRQWHEHDDIERV